MKQMCKRFDIIAKSVGVPTSLSGFASGWANCNQQRKDVEKRKPQLWRRVRAQADRRHTDMFMGSLDLRFANCVNATG